MSGIDNDFYGRKPYVWFIGVVERANEQDNDPLEIGRVRVRIIGHHSRDKSLVPTESLPWAQVVHSPNSQFSTSVIKPGLWVTGFFSDGELAQTPIITGIFSGVDTEQLNNADDAKPLSHVEGRAIGQPDLANRLSRGVYEKTGVSNTNKNLTGVCDVLVVSKINTAFQLHKQEIMLAIRKVMNAITMALGSDPTGFYSTIMSFLKKIKEYLKLIQYYIKKIKLLLKYVFAVIKLIQAIIAFIASLPGRIAKFIMDCVRKALSAVMNGVSGIISGATGEISSSLSGGLNSFGELASEFNSVMGEVQTTTSAISNLGNIDNYPTDQEESDAIDKLYNADSVEGVTAAFSGVENVMSKKINEVTESFKADMKSVERPVNIDPDTLEPT